MNTHQRLLETFFIKQADHDHKRIYGKSLTAKARKKLLKNFQVSLNDKDVYTHYEIKNGKLLKFIQAKVVNHSFDGKFIYISPLLLEHKKMIPSELKQVSLFYDNQYTISLRSLPENIKNYKKLGFKIKGFWLSGNVNKSLKRLNEISKNNPLDGDFEEMNYDRDMNKVVRLIVDAHNKCETSIVKFNTPDRLKKMKGHLQEMSEQRSIFLYKVNNKIVGAIGYLKNKDVPGTALVGFIAVTPKLQGLGISKNLYKKAFEDMKSKKIKFFTGISSTDKVVGLSQRMKRDVAFAVMWRESEF